MEDKLEVQRDTIGGKMQKTFVKILWPAAVLLAIVLLSGPAQAEPPTQKSADIRQLLIVSGILEQLGYMQSKLLNSYSVVVKGPYPKVPDEFWDEYYDLINKKDMETLLQRIIPVYEKHMSHETVLRLVEMFETPFWREWRQKMPAISQEAGIVGSEWGAEIIQSEAFNTRLDALIQKHDLSTLNKK